MTHEANPEELLSTVTSIQVLDWGNRVDVCGVDDPITRGHYCFSFRDCTEINWTFFGSEQIDPEVNLIGVIIGEPSGQPAVITTETCEVAIKYRSYHIERVVNSRGK